MSRANRRSKKPNGGSRRNQTFDLAIANDRVWVDSGRKLLGQTRGTRAAGTAAGIVLQPDVSRTLRGRTYDPNWAACGLEAIGLSSREEEVRHMSAIKPVRPRFRGLTRVPCPKWRLAAASRCCTTWHRSGGRRNQRLAKAEPAAHARSRHARTSGRD